MSNDVSRIKKIPSVDFIFVREADNFKLFVQAVNRKNISLSSIGGVISKYRKDKWYSFDQYSIPTEEEISEMPAYELVPDLKIILSME